MSNITLNPPRFLARQAADRLRSGPGRRWRPASLALKRSRPGLRLKRRSPLRATAILPSLSRTARPALWRQVSRRQTDQVTAVKPRYRSQPANAPTEPVDLPLVGPTLWLPTPDDEQTFKAETVVPPSDPPVSMAQLREILAQRSRADAAPPMERPSPRLSPRPEPASPPPPPARRRLQTKRQRFSRIEELPARPVEPDISSSSAVDPEEPSAGPTSEPESPLIPAEPTPPAPVPPLRSTRKAEAGLPAGPAASAEAPESPERSLPIEGPGIFEPPAQSVEPARPPSPPVADLGLAAPSVPQPPAPPIQPVSREKAAPVVQTSPPEEPLPAATKPSPLLEDEPPATTQARPTPPPAARSEQAFSESRPVSPSKTGPKEKPKPLEPPAPRLHPEAALPFHPVQRRPVDETPATPPTSEALLGKDSGGQAPASPAETAGPVAAPDLIRSQAPPASGQPRPAPVEPSTPEPPPALSVTRQTTDLRLSRPHRVVQRIAARPGPRTRTSFKPLTRPAPAIKPASTAPSAQQLVEPAPTSENMSVPGPRGETSATQLRPLPARSIPGPALQAVDWPASAPAAATAAATGLEPSRPSPAKLEPPATGPIDLPLPVIHRPAAGSGPVMAQRRVALGEQTTPAQRSEPQTVARQPVAAPDRSEPADSPTTKTPAGPSKVDLDDLARQVYPLLKLRLALERERQPW